MVFSSSFSFVLCCVVILAAVFVTSEAQLTPNFYEKVCPEALPTIKGLVKKAIEKEPRMGASLLRLHFHDCFVNGCDGSVLLADTANFTGEMTAFPNNNSIRGFEVIDEIKAAVNSACGNVVSCADILAVAARDSVAKLGGPSYKVLLGRQDSLNASWMDANTNLPAPFLNLTGLLISFSSKNLNLQDLVVLSAAHTIGLAQCATFRTRIYNDTNIEPSFQADRQRICPPVFGTGDNTTVGLDGTPFNFDNAYFNNLLAQKGLLHSDQELFKHDFSAADFLVRRYSTFPEAFMKDFGDSMIKMGNLKPPTGAKTEIRMNCSKIN
ncbi:hypothetical protein MKW98_020669 [Papaver atlanticum]|uniref:Peroxidase n=1 Tax=Papaver atlanticum TaxID=357466 RepID=A0AAD4XY99_9MAGN|nr:hypothetical protein MKW98_020669 [Papaver atlanticum]